MATALALVSPAAVAAAPQIPATAAVATADAEAGAHPLAAPEEFREPGNDVRPEWRWWWADPYRLTQTEKEIRAMHEAGFSGAEIGFSASSWATPEQRANLGRAIDVADELDFELDLTLGAAWPLATPATAPETGLAQLELQYGRLDVAGPGSWTGEVPAPYDDPDNERDAELVAVTAAKVLEAGPAVQPPEEPSGPHYPGDPGNTEPPAMATVLDETSLVDLSDQVEAGTLAWTVPEGDWILFAFWERPILQSGGSAVSLFDAASVDAATAHLAEVQIGAENAAGLREVGGSFFEDSLEYQAQSALWSDAMLEEFRARRGYDLTPYLPLIFVQGMSRYWVPEVEPTPDFVLPEDVSDGVRHDYNELLTDLYVDEHILPLVDWAKEYDMAYRTQPAYGQNLDVIRSARETVEAGGLVEDESLNAGGWDPPYDTSFGGHFDFGLDHHRAVVAGAHQAGSTQITSELGASKYAYRMTLDDYKTLMDNAWGVGVTRPIVHGYGYQAEGATWPGTNRFGGFVAESWNAETYPEWPFWRGLADYWARGTKVLQSGTARTDVAVYFDGFVTTAATLEGFNPERPVPPAPLFDGHAMERAGYSYQYIDPAGVAEPAARGEGVLYPDTAGYRALVIDDRELSLPAAEALSQDVGAGLAVVFVGDLPMRGTTYANGAAVDERVGDIVTELADSPRVRRVATPDDVPAALADLGVEPRTRWSDPVQVYSQFREADGADYAYVHNPTPDLLQFGAEFETTGTPYRLDPFTGDITRIAEYSVEGSRVIIPLELAAGENVFIGFDATTPADGQLHVVATDAAAVRILDDELVVVDEGGATRTVTLSDGRTFEVQIPDTPEPVTIDDWSLDVLEAGPGEPVEHSFALEELQDWRELPGLEDVSGVGTYRTTLALDGDWSAGGPGTTVLDLGSVAGGSVRVEVNGEVVSVDPTGARSVDVGEHLRAGTNELTVILGTTLGNRLTEASDAYGLLGPVVLHSYGTASVDLTEPAPTPTSSPSSPAPTDPGTVVPSTEPPGGDRLPSTGAAAGALAGVALLALLGGLALAARRRRPAHATGDGGVPPAVG